MSTQPSQTTSPSSPATSPDPSAFDFLAIAFAWAVPGLGHIMIGKWARGLVFALTIHGLFGAGLLLGGVRAINPPDQPIWTYTQFLTGWPMLIANRLQKQQEPIIDGIGQQLENGGGDRPSLDAPVEQREAFGKALIKRYPIFAYHPKIQDIGSVYCGIAGMLNLLVIFDVLLRATGTPRVVVPPKNAQEPTPDATGGQS